MKEMKKRTFSLGETPIPSREPQQQACHCFHTGGMPYLYGRFGSLQQAV